MQVLERGDLVFSIRGDALCIRAESYGTPATFLANDALETIGLRVPDDGRRPPSRALSEMQTLARPLFKEPLGPAITDASWTPPEGSIFGDYLLVAVRGGLDVYVQAFDPVETRIPLAALVRLGIVQRVSRRR